MSIRQYIVVFTVFLCGIVIGSVTSSRNPSRGGPSFYLPTGTEIELVESYPPSEPGDTSISGVVRHNLTVVREKDSAGVGPQLKTRDGVRRSWILKVNDFQWSMVPSDYVLHGQIVK